MIQRTSEYTDFILCDGMGSGPKANMSAIMCASRILRLLQSGISLYRACEKAVQLMHRARTENIPFAAFTVVRILKSGRYTALSYEIPAPILVQNGLAEIVKQRHFPSAHEILSEAEGTLDEGASLVICSDGVAQAGLGVLPGFGWSIEGYCDYVNHRLNRGYTIDEIADDTLGETYQLSGNVHGDDTSVAVLTAREAHILNILTGPPKSKSQDTPFVQSFMKMDGEKVVCGSTTSDIVARELNTDVVIRNLGTQFNQPPKYHIDGIDLATEGAVTLNQVYNIIDVDTRHYDNSSVCQLARMLKDSDIIHLFIGDAANEAHTDIAFMQLGVLERAKIIQLIIDKLRDMGKIVKITSP